MGTTRDRPLAAFSLVFGLGMLAYGLVEYRDFIADDAYITLRYARHWLAGLGPVWNPGERVEGYTSFLMLALVTALGSLGLDLVVAARLVNWVSLVALVLFLIAFLRSRARGVGASELAAALPVMLVAGSFPLAIWVWGAMEGPLFAFLCTAGLATTLTLLERPAGWRRALTAGVALALAVLTRPDGALFLGFAGIALASCIPAHGRPAARQLMIVALTSAAILAPHLAWRFSYYGAWLPNSVVAKTTGLPAGLSEPGLSYVVDFLLLPPFVALLGFGGLVLALSKAPRDRGLYLLLASTVVYPALVARVGGDYLPAARFLTPLIPLFGLLLFRGLVVVLRAASWRSAAAVVAGLGLLILQPYYFAKQEIVDPAEVVGTIIGRHIADKWAPGTLVALHTAGSTPYFAPDYVYIDMLGLNDAHIARRRVEEPRSRWHRLPGHTKGDARYVLERDPDIIIAGPAGGTTIERPWFLSDFEMAREKVFRERYRLRVERIAMPRRGDFMTFTYYQRVPR